MPEPVLATCSLPPDPVLPPSGQNSQIGGGARSFVSVELFKNRPESAFDLSDQVETGGSAWIPAPHALDPRLARLGRL
jgi:hypothetical protein